MSSSESEFSSSISSTSSFISAQETLVLFPDWESSDFHDVLYDDSLEPVATEEESTVYCEQVAKEESEETEFKKRFDGQVEVQTWCNCSNCSLELVVKAEECFCCQEMPRCTDKMAEVDLDDECITEHPGFRNVCLDKWVLETAAIGLKTKKNRQSYITLYRQGKKSEPEFLRSVAYRQIVRFIWDYMGNTMRTPLSACIYNAIRKEFPSETGSYKGFEIEEEEEEDEGLEEEEEEEEDDGLEEDEEEGDI